MKTRPVGVDDDAVAQALIDGWDFAVVQLAFSPVGFGSYHWIAADGHGDRRFVTIDHLAAHADDHDVAFDGLARAFATATRLREHGCGFAVAPLPTTGGSPVRRLSADHAISVFPWVDGRAGEWGVPMADVDRLALADALAELHGATASDRPLAPDHGSAPLMRSIEQVEGALDHSDHPWTGGPFAEPARLWLRDRQSAVRALIAETKWLFAATAPTTESLVITHGEPHPGNVIRTSGGLALIDWDTVGLARPERDLWFLADDEHALARYTSITGTVVDRNAIASYRNAWAIADLAVFMEEFRARHDQDDDTVHAWRTLTELRF